MLKQWFWVLLLNIILTNLSGNRGLLQWIEKVCVKVCGFRLVNFDPFSFLRFAGFRLKLGFQLQSSHVNERCSNEMSAYQFL